ncbi:hypothetical protein H8356DRAFT_1337905 [Neocallimastix lanati (nom. inval.)]|nr:hypothetical protein H8356DRAFT_1337905 [Neocallimastix sp. JGI-2020a]
MKLSVDIKMIRHEFSPPNERSDIWEKLEAMASNSVNAEKTVRQASRASATNEDHNFSVDIKMIRHEFSPISERLDTNLFELALLSKPHLECGALDQLGHPGSFGRKF